MSTHTYITASLMEQAYTPYTTYGYIEIAAIYFMHAQLGQIFKNIYMIPGEENDLLIYIISDRFVINEEK